MLPTLLLAAAMAAPPCWTIFDTALRTSAVSAHPEYVSYDEHITITQDDLPLLQSIAFVDYRDDGLARVRDERFAYAPILTRQTEPGPPELGPYGLGRQSWIPQAQSLRTIASVRAEGDMKCTYVGEEIYKGHDTYHVRFSGVSPTRPTIKAMWVDTTSGVVWKVIVSGIINFAQETSGPPTLADFQVDIGYAGPYLVVNHVVWSLRHRQYSQITNYFGEYTLSNYDFPQSLPASYFVEQTAAR